MHMNPNGDIMINQPEEESEFGDGDEDLQDEEGDEEEEEEGSEEEDMEGAGVRILNCCPGSARLFMQ